MKEINLCGEWQLIGQDENHNEINITGNVPGCVHTDLIKNNYFENIFYRDNSKKTLWVEKENWTYLKKFNLLEVKSDAYLCFESLDTYCEIFLNNFHIGSSENMFILQKFSCQNYLKPGENEIRIIFYSPVEKTKLFPQRNAAFTAERLYTRRIQCTYGWDWAERFVTMGICGEAKLIFEDLCEISEVYIHTKSIDLTAQIELNMLFAPKKEGMFAEYKIFDPNNKVIYSKKRLIVEKNIDEVLDIENPLLWFPYGYGEQYLYSISIIVFDGEEKICEKNDKFGIRIVKLLERPDSIDSENFKLCEHIKETQKKCCSEEMLDKNEEYSGFIVLINNVPIMCKGANYVPCEPFISSETPGKITKILTLSQNANMNLLRIWGGGIFESDYFYSECDRKGLMVTQDFLMACGDYPENDPKFLDELRKEAKFAALKLRNHPCLIYYTGDNENGMSANENIQDYTGRKAALTAISPILRTYDPDRRFLPSSPYKGTPYGSITNGTTHYTNFVGDWFWCIYRDEMKDYQEFFNNTLSRACVEYPALGAPNEITLKEFMTDEDIYGENENMWHFHTKTNPAFTEFDIFQIMSILTEKCLGKYKNANDKVFKLQYIQYETIRISMELYRRNKWFSSGLLYWMLNDNWPSIGWAIIDYYNRPKAAYYAFKRAAKKQIASFEKGKNKLSVFVCNDELRAINGSVEILKVVPKSGKIEEILKTNFEVSANISKKILNFDYQKEENCVYIANISGENFCDRAIFFEKTIEELNLPESDFEIVKGENEIKIKAKNYIHALELKYDEVVEDNYFTMLPNEEKIVKIL